MSTDRRRFLLQTGMAATAFLVAKPFSVFGKYTSPLSTSSLNHSQVTFLHTAGQGSGIAKQLGSISASRQNLVLLHAGASASNSNVNYDASLHSIEDELVNDYKVITRNNMRIGIVTARTDEDNVIGRINHLSTFLKEEKNCRLVVCISQLGFRAKNTTDDITLAAKTTNLDIIIGKRKDNSPAHPYIAMNKKNAEVIIQHTEDHETAVGKINIAFSKSGDRQSVSF